MLTSNTQDHSPVTKIKTSKENNIGFVVSNEPTKADYIFINNLLAAHLENRESLQLLLQLENLIDIEVNYLFNELATTFEFYPNKTSVAVIAPTAMKKEIAMENLDSANIVLKYFQVGQQKAAEEWLENQIKKSST